MAGNITDDWPDFVSTSISYFILILLYAVMGADVIVLSKIFPLTYIANDCGNSDLTYADYIFPTDPEKPPYGGVRTCPKTRSRKTQADLMTCAYTDVGDETISGNIEGKSVRPGIIWDFLQKMGMSDVSWPYTNLYKGLDKQGNPRGGLGYWYSYTIANIVFEGFKTSRQVFKFLSTILGIIPDPVLLLLGPIFLCFIIFAANISALYGSFKGAFGPLFGIGGGDLPSMGIAWGMIGGGLILFSTMIIVQGQVPGIFKTWWGNLINVIVMIIVMALGGFVFVLPAINTLIVILNTLFSMLYPLMAQNGKFTLNVLFCNKEFISLIYSFAVCAIAYAYLNSTLAYTMWIVWAIMVAIKIFQAL